MTDKIKNIFNAVGIELVEAISLKYCNIVREYKLKRYFNDLTNLNAIMIVVPYLVSGTKRNLSAYAVSRDYHLFFKELFDEVIPRLKEQFSQYTFCGFADDSPIDERDAAALAGLGIIGDNGMLITDKYSSYVFIGEIITDMPIDTNEPCQIKRCEGCGACMAHCPMKEIGICLSALTQKKGELEYNEKNAIIKYGSAWGCDICQEVCPHTAKAITNKTIYTGIKFFYDDTIPHLTLDALDKMSNEAFSARAYSWRGRQTIRRNLELLEANDKNPIDKE